MAYLKSYSELSTTPEKTQPFSLKVMVVDDSAVIRSFITRILTSDSRIQVIASAMDGAQALGILKKTTVDIVILDIDMPIKDGLETLPEILKLDPNIKVIMASTLTKRNATLSLKALALGASDYVAKPTSNREIMSQDDFKNELLSKVISYGQKSLASFPITASPATTVSSNVIISSLATDLKNVSEETLCSLRPWPSKVIQAVAIGASTGGPQVLLDILRHFPKSFPVPILITQHMPPRFTLALAEHLQKVAGVPVFEAKDGQLIGPGEIYIAPGGFHMEVARPVASPNKLVVRLHEGPTENYCRPSVDPLFRSLAHHLQGQVLGIILTGMGSDGLKGSQILTQCGGALVAQNQASSVVWGMPGAVAKAGLCSSFESPEGIRALLEQISHHPRFPL